jgi:hypothetical protein
LAEDLAEAGANRDLDLALGLMILIEALEGETADAAAASGIDLDELKAGVVSATTEVRARNWDARGGIRISDVAVGVDKVVVGSNVTIEVGRAVETSARPSDQPVHRSFLDYMTSRF